jgi:predicted permease
MVLNSLFPVFALLLLGHLLKRFNFTDAAFLRTVDRMVYFVFFPAMLFWKIGSASTGMTIDWPYCLSALCALLIMFLLSLVALPVFKVTAFQAGSFCQACFRFNTYIGMTIILTTFGESGVKHFGILIGLVIPVVNVLSVLTLIWYSAKRYAMRERLVLTLKAVVSNPLILACLAGLAYNHYVSQFPVFIDNTLEIMSMVALPMALLSIGASLTFKSLRGNLAKSFAASLLKVAGYPLIGYGLMSLFGVSTLPFQVGMIYFALPASTAIYVLSSQLNSDTELASAAIVMSTILAFFSLSVILVILPLL